MFPFLLDNKANKQYSSVDKRLQLMNNPNEYAGYLEIMTTAWLLKLQIWLHCAQEEFYILRAKLPATTFIKQVSIRILYRVDTAKSAGHFDFIVSNSKSNVCSIVSNICMERTNSLSGTLYKEIVDDS